MKVHEIETINDIKEGDIIIISGDMYDRHPVKVPMVKVSESDGTEIIIDKKKNHYFNLQMFLQGSSWVKECVKIA